MKLIDSIIKHGGQSVALVGMAKNVGKTVTLNYIVRQGSLLGLRFGLTSIGLDGEREDTVFGNPKPGIFLPEGTCIATAKQFINNSNLSFEILNGTGIFTPFGEIMLAKNCEPGQIELVGPSTGDELQMVKRLMQEHGVDLFVIDGALNRRSLASPSLADAMFLATGAAVSRDIETIVRKTAYQLRLCELMGNVNERQHELIKVLFETGKSAIIGKDYSVKELGIETVLGNEEHVAENVTCEDSILVIDGALTNGLLRCIKHSINIVVRDATSIFVEDDNLQRFLNKGGRVSVFQEINVLGVTINPMDSTGTFVNSHTLGRVLSKRIAPIPVYDVVTDECFVVGEIKSAN